MSTTDNKFPFPEGPLATQPPEYVRRRTECPLGEVTTPSGDTAMLAVRHEDVEAIMRDPRFTRDLSAPGSPSLFPGDSLSADRSFLVNMDGPDHLRLRRIVAAAFTPKRAEQWRPEIRAIVDELLDPIEQAGPPADLINAVSKGDVDVAIAWGPLAGYFAHASKVPLQISRVHPDEEPPFPFVFDMSMGVARSNTALRDELNRVIAENQPAIDAILRDYSVPTIEPAKVASR